MSKGNHPNILSLYMDGSCLLCMRLVRFINTNANRNSFFEIYAIQNCHSLDLPDAVRSLKSVGIKAEQSPILIRYKAVKLVLYHCRNRKRCLYLISKIIPVFLGDLAYNLVARVRLKIGRLFYKKECLLPASFYPLNPDSRVQLISKDAP